MRFWIFKRVDKLSSRANTDVQTFDKWQFIEVLREYEDFQSLGSNRWEWQLHGEETGLPTEFGPAGVSQVSNLIRFSAVALDSLTNQRIRKSLTHGGGIDGVLFTILAGVGIVTAILILIAGLQTAENKAEQAVGTQRTRAALDQNSEIGTD